MMKKGSYVWELRLVHPTSALGVRTWYAQVEARKQSTKVTLARMTGKKMGEVESGRKS